MSELRLNMRLSLDGYVAGPEQSAENPFGLGGMQLKLEQVEVVAAPGVTHITYRVW
jgi:hypothetical protein